MDWTRTVFDVIDMRSFSNLWYWIALAAAWSLASHYVLGVPFDMIGRAARKGGRAQADLEDLIRIRSGRLLSLVEVLGAWLVASLAMVLTVLFVLGVAYGLEFAQATFLIAFPMTLAKALSVRCARQIRSEELRGAALRRRVSRHRFSVQAIGMVSIFITAMWGMYRNMAAGPLG